MCTYNDKPWVIKDLRDGPPSVTVYKAVVLKGKTPWSSGHHWRWAEGWQIAKGSAPTDYLHSQIELDYYNKNGIYPHSKAAEGGGFHLSLTLADAKAWCQPGDKCNAVIKVLVDPKDIFAAGTPNQSKGRTDICAKRCYVQSTVPVWRRPTREEIRAAERKAKAKLAAKLKTKKKRKK